MRSGIVLLSLESIKILKLETFQVDKARDLSRFMNVIGVQSLNY